MATIGSPWPVRVTSGSISAWVGGRPSRLWKRPWTTFVLASFDWSTLSATCARAPRRSASAFLKDVSSAVAGGRPRKILEERGEEPVVGAAAPASRGTRPSRGSAPRRSRRSRSRAGRARTPAPGLRAAVQEGLVEALDEPRPVLDALQHVQGDVGAGRAALQPRLVEIERRLVDRALQRVAVHPVDPEVVGREAGERQHRAGTEAPMCPGRACPCPAPAASRAAACGGR